MGMPAARQVQSGSSLDQLAEHPVYFFDTRFLLASVSTSIGWTSAKLEIALTPRIERALGPSDLWLGTPDGYYVIFVSCDAPQARAKATTISIDVLRHFYGESQFPLDAVNALCRPSSMHNLADVVARDAIAAKAKPSPPVRARGEEEVPATAQEQCQLTREVIQLYRDRTGLTENGLKPSFAPTWDSRRNRITSFVYGDVDSPQTRGVPLGAGGLEVAEAQCKIDAMALAGAAKGVQHIRSRGWLAIVSVPVHAETLAWRKSRSAYLRVLSQIEPQLLPFLSPRIVGFNAGFNPVATAQWIAALRRHVRLAFVHLPDVNLEMRGAMLGCTALGISFPSLLAPGATGQVLREQTAKFVNLCAAQGAIACVDRVKSKPVLSVLKNCGVRLVSGPAVGEASPLPSPAGVLDCDIHGAASASSPS